MVSQKPKYCKHFERNNHWRKLSMIMVWERYCNASPKPEFFFIFFVYIFIHISANMSPFGLKFSQMIIHTETSKLMYNWSFLFVHWASKETYNFLEWCPLNSTASKLIIFWFMLATVLLITHVKKQRNQKCQKWDKCLQITTSPFSKIT